MAPPCIRFGNFIERTVYLNNISVVCAIPYREKLSRKKSNRQKILVRKIWLLTQNLVTFCRPNLCSDLSFFFFSFGAPFQFSVRLILQFFSIRVPLNPQISENCKQLSHSAIWSIGLSWLSRLLIYV